MRKTAIILVVCMLVSVSFLSGCNEQQSAAVKNEPPTATLSANTMTGTLFSVIEFTGSGEDPDGIIVTYEWDFGDGSISNEQNPSHFFQKSGTFYVTLTVTDEKGTIGTNTIVITIEDNGEKDTDGDGLSDALEFQIGTDPNDENTDGDRYDDYMEQTGINLPSYVKGKAASPLYPAVPDIQVTPSTSFEIYLAREITTGEETISEGTYKFESGYQETTNTLFNAFVEAGVEGDIFKAIFSGQLPFYIKSGVYYSNQHTTNLYSNERYIMTEKQRWYQAEKTDLAGSYIKVPIHIKNIGSDILQSEIADILVNLYIGNDTFPSLDDWHLAGENYHISKIKPGDSSVTITAKFYGLSVDKLYRIDNKEGIRIVVEHFSFGEDEMYLLDAVNRLIKITIDNGESVIYDYVRPDEANKFVNIISSITDIVVENGEIISVGGISKTTHSLWEVIVPTNSDIDTMNELLNNVFTTGDEIVLIYLKDTDGNNIIDREEILLGLNPNSDDTDGDTLNDYDELSGKYNSNPVLSDSDFDSLILFHFLLVLLG